MKKIALYIMLLLLLTGCGIQVSDEGVPNNSHTQSSEIEECNDIPVTDSSSTLLSPSSSCSDSSSDLPLNENSTDESHEVTIPPRTKEEESLTTLSEWMNLMMKENDITNLSDYDLAVYELDRQICEALNGNIYGGTSKIGKTYIGRNENEIYFFSTGIRVYYVEYSKVKSIVDDCLKNYDYSLGKIEILFETCKYSLNELNQFVAEIEREITNNTTLKKSVGNFDIMIYDGVIAIYIKQGRNELEEYLKKVSFSDCVHIVDNSAPIPVA